MVLGYTFKRLAVTWGPHWCHGTKFSGSYLVGLLLAFGGEGHCDLGSWAMGVVAPWEEGNGKRSGCTDWGTFFKRRLVDEEGQDFINTNSQCVTSLLSLPASAQSSLKVEEILPFFGKKKLMATGLAELCPWSWSAVRTSSWFPHTRDNGGCDSSLRNSEPGECSYFQPWKVSVQFASCSPPLPRVLAAPLPQGF